MTNIPIGATGEQKILVTSDLAISFLGLEAARVLSTPNMILHMERTCRNTVFPLLDSGYDTVGTHVDVYHLAAAPMGTTVTFRAEVISATDRRVQFRVEAWDEQEKVGEGTHERAIINVAKFATRLAAKKSGA
jgi:fluoroacetyl-CoA thioesterase